MTPIAEQKTLCVRVHDRFLLTVLLTTYSLVNISSVHLNRCRPLTDKTASNAAIYRQSFLFDLIKI